MIRKIKIDSKTDISYIEKAYSQINETDTFDILISKRLTSKEFGFIPALIQFFATWYKKTVQGKIVFDIKDLSELEEFYNLDFLFPVLVYCWERNMVDTNGNDIKNELKILNAAKHEKMRKQTEGGGQKVMLSCFDHLSIKKGLLNAFYIDGSLISNEMQFDLAIEKSLRQVTNLNKSLFLNNYSPIHLEIIAIIYELIKNTDDWARTDENNKPLNPNTRGLFMKLHRGTRESFISSFANKIELKDYFSNDSFESNTQDELYFLEISVYDTGIGFIKRNTTLAMNAEHDINHQVETIKKCLIRNNTSAIGIASGIKGQGLDRIMQILSNKGLFWIRTENASLFRNLKSNRYKENTTSEDIVLFDWSKNSSTNYTHFSNVQGSVVTLVYPFSNLSNV